MRHANPVRCLIRENGKTGKPENGTRLVCTVGNSAYAVRLETAPTGGESVYLFLEFTINDPIIPLTYYTSTQPKTKLKFDLPLYTSYNINFELDP